MARKKKIQQIAESILDYLRKSSNDYTIGMVIIDKKRGEVCYAQSATEQPFYPLAALIDSDRTGGVFKTVADMVSDESQDIMRDLLDDSEGVCTDVQCFTCARFNEKSHHFGTCKYEEGVFDGEEFINCDRYRNDGSNRQGTRN